MELYNKKPKVLYVDDEKDNLLVFKSSFRRIYDVSTATSAFEGEEIALKENFDVIISDHLMPDKTGVEFLNDLEDGIGTLRIILTGYSDIDAVIEALNTGKIDKYISKPWSKSSLQKLNPRSVLYI